jgi:hypothetical protein
MCKVKGHLVIFLSHSLIPSFSDNEEFCNAPIRNCHDRLLLQSILHIMILQDPFLFGFGVSSRLYVEFRVRFSSENCERRISRERIFHVYRPNTYRVVLLT